MPSQTNLYNETLDQGMMNEKISAAYGDAALHKKDEINGIIM
jgi:hypothetical protein